MHETGLFDLLTGNGRPHISRSCVVQPGWWYSWPMASTLASLCLSQMRTFWTCVMTINLFSLYLMNFMFHHMLDATGVVLRVHYKSMKCDVVLSQGRVRTIFRWGGHCFIHESKMSSSLQQCKNYKNRLRFSTVMVTNVLPPFLWFTVYFSSRHNENPHSQHNRSRPIFAILNNAIHINICRLQRHSHEDADATAAGRCCRWRVVHALNDASWLRYRIRIFKALRILELQIKSYFHRSRIRILRFFSFLKFNEFYEFFLVEKNSVKIRDFANHRYLTCFDVLECNVHL